MDSVLKQNKQVLTLSAEKNSPVIVRRFLEEVMEESGFSGHKYSGLEVSVTEHIENLIRHAYKGKSGEITVVAEIKYPEAKITINDKGPAFNMKKKKLPNLPGRIKKGLGGKMGIKTILSMCDTVKYRRVKGANENVFIIRESA